MGWQDREYAKHAGPYRPVGYVGRPGMSGNRSIVTTLIIINVAIFVVQSFSDPAGEFLFDFGAMQGKAVLHGQVWRLITAQYLHAGTWHLVFNMIGLHFLGRPIERMWSTRKFLTIYTLSGLCGNLFFTLLAAREVINPNTPAVGASGCILGLLGIMAVLFPNATVFIFPIPFPLKIRTVAMILAAVAFMAIIQRSNNYGGEACHLAGLAFGVWWAMKGDAWWRTTDWSWRRRPRITRPGRSARPAASGGFAGRVAQRREDTETIDRILKKVYEGGIQSLSESEKRALQDATERQRRREQEAGRVDRI